MIGRAAGIARSLVTYYGPVWRRRRFEAFYRQFLQEGDLSFDVGAHVGNRVRVFRRIGARVIAIEPQPDFVTVLRLLYGRDSDVTIEAGGVAAETGEGKLHLSSRTPTVSTFADSWMNDVQADRRFQRIRWDTVISVPLVTLDELIARYGEPQFCKIDVEGFEHEVLSGSQPGNPGVVLRIHSGRHRPRDRLRGANERSGSISLSTLAGRDSPLGGARLAGAQGHDRDLARTPHR